MKPLVFFLIFCFSIKSAAQDSSFSLSGQITKKGVHWRMDGSKLNLKELKSAIYKVPEAIPYYKRANNRKVIGFSLLAPAVAFAFLGRMNLDVNSPRYGNNRSGFSAAAIITYGTSIFFMASSLKQLKKAVGKYNEGRKLIY